MGILLHACRWRRRRQDQISGDMIVVVALARRAAGQLASHHIRACKPAGKDQIDRRPHLNYEQIGLCWREVQPPEFGTKLATKRIAGSISAQVDGTFDGEAAIVALKPLADRAFVPEPGVQGEPSGAPIGVVFNEQFDEFGCTIFVIKWDAGDDPALLQQGGFDP